MIQNEYINAVDKLEFSGDLLERVHSAAEKKPGFRLARLAVVAAVLGLIMATTVFGAVSLMRERPGNLVEIGTVTEPMTDAEIMNFRVSEGMEGVSIHYMELNPNQQYALRHGMLRSAGDYLLVTEEYTLESVEVKRVNATLEKDGRVYALTFDYLDTAKGILSNHRSIYHKNADGEILLCAADGSRGQWPVYLNVESGEIRDAIPDWTAEDFRGRISGADTYRGGILLSTVLEGAEGISGEEENGRTECADSLLYWLAPGEKEAKMIEISQSGMYYVENDTIFVQDTSGKLFAIDEEFEFYRISDYTRTSPMQDGLMTVSVGGKMGIVDAFAGQTYVFDQMKVQPWDAGDYSALRYGNAGTIALVHTDWRHDPERIVLTGLGIVDYETGELKMLNIENDYDGYQHGWLDEHRFAVVYRSGARQFLCIYEFTQ